jgi:hypothetical protein
VRAQFRRTEDATPLGIGFGVWQVTAHRWLTRGDRGAGRPRTRTAQATQQATGDRSALVMPDGKLFDSDHLAQIIRASRGQAVDA